MPWSTAAVSTNGLNADPGWRSPWAARLNWLSSYVSDEAIARISPVSASVETRAAAAPGV